MNFGERRVIQGEPFLTHSERKIAQPARLLWAIQRVFVSKVCQQNARLWLIMLTSYATMLNHYLIRGSPADRLQKLKDSHLRAGADGGDRTHTTLRSLDFESSAYTREKLANCHKTVQIRNSWREMQTNGRSCGSTPTHLVEKRGWWIVEQST
jgi:hypothetical protein